MRSRGRWPQTGLAMHESPLPLPHQTVVGPLLSALVEWLRLVVEAAGAIVIFVGVLVALRRLIRELRGYESFTETRQVLARYLALALELQLGADILSTAIAPSWDQIGKLGAIAVIRTFLNFFLQREMHEKKQEKPAA